MIKVSQVIEAKNVTNVYYSWGDELRLDVDGGTLNVKLNSGSLREIAKILNEKIEEQDEEERQKKEEEEVEQE